MQSDPFVVGGAGRELLSVRLRLVASTVFAAAEAPLP